MFVGAANRRADIRLEPRHARGMTFGEWLLVLFACGFLIFLLISFLVPARRVVRPAAMQTACRNHLKQIGMALEAYYKFHKTFPPTCTVDAEGTPLHSWRTLLLPYLDQRETYYRLDLSRPWDDPVNAKLLERLPVSVFRCPAAKLAGRHDTTYFALRMPENRFRVPEVRTFTERAAGMPELLIVVEVDTSHAVPWMSPRDADPAMFLGIDKRSRISHPKGTHGLFANGVVQYFPAAMPLDERRKVLAQGLTNASPAAAPKARSDH